MKNLFLIIGVVAGMAFVSCSDKKVTATDIKPEIPVKGETQNNIIDGTYVHNMDTLHYKFDNAKSNAVLKFKGEDIQLKQDTMASGIKYSNDKYVYTEHQGKITLTKDGKVIFSHQR